MSGGFYHRVSYRAILCRPLRCEPLRQVHHRLLVELERLDTAHEAGVDGVVLLVDLRQLAPPPVHGRASDTSCFLIVSYLSNRQDFKN